MKITDFSFSIDHAADGSAIFTLFHGGDHYCMALSPEQRRALALNPLDPTLSEANTTADEEVA